MDNDFEEAVYPHLLYANLLAACPVDTGNMKDHITIKEYEDKFVIKVSMAVDDKGYNYSRAVNYNPQRTPKEARNYMWVERTINQTTRAVFGGGEIKNEL